MKIAIDVNLMAENRTGIGNYIYHLIKHLAKIDNQNKYLLYGFFLKNYFDRQKKIFIPNQNNFSLQTIPIPMRLIDKTMNFLHLSLDLFFKNIDILHLTSFTFLPTQKAKVIATIYDLASFFYPELYPSYQKKRLDRFYNFVKKTEKIIAISYQTKLDLINILGIEQKKIKVIYPGIDENFKIIQEKNIIEKTMKKYSIDQEFILYVGTLQPRKNIPNLIKSYYKLLQNNKNFSYKLVLCGKKGWLFQDIFDLVKELNIENKVIFTNYMNNEDLVYLYNAASIFVYPSLYEGFGLPIIEAMACGVPVITSNLSSLKEIGKDAAYLVNPNNINELSEAILNILSNKKLKEDLKIKGLLKSKSFRWEKTALEVLDVYKEMM